MLRSRLHAALVALALVSALVLTLRATGWLARAELAVYDQYIRYASPSAQRDPRIALVVINEEDIRALDHWPISDGALARVLRTILAAEPRAVGVDIYRDRPEPPGLHALEDLLGDDERIIWIRKMGGGDQAGIPGPSVLQDTQRVGFVDILLDEDERVRRGLLFLDDGNEPEYSLALRLALHALASHGVTPAGDPEEPSWLRLGPSTLRPLGSEDGGYVGADDAGYQFLLDYSSARAGFETFHLSKLLAGEVSPDRLRGRIVLLGINAESSRDFFPVPFQRGLRTGIDSIPGIELHAHMALQLLRHGLGETAPMKFLPGSVEAGLVVASAALGCLLALVARGNALWGVSAQVATLFLAAASMWGAGAAAYRFGLWIPMMAPGLALVGAMGAVTIWSMNRETQDRSVLMKLFSRHVSSEVAEEIWRRRAEFFRDGRLRSRRLVASVLFVDMKGYTANAEKMEPDSLMEWLNEFMAAMTQEIYQFGGMVDDYFGDGIKANFGVPLARETPEEIARDARCAVRCAIEMGHRLDRLNASYESRGLPRVGMRVGIHTGPVVVGEIGQEERVKFTSVGDVVIQAQRLEATDAVEHDFDAAPCRILISESTRAHLDESIHCVAVGPVALKGRGEKVNTHRVMGRRSIEAGTATPQ